MGQNRIISNDSALNLPVSSISCYKTASCYNVSVSWNYTKILIQNSDDSNSKCFICLVGGIGNKNSLQKCSQAERRLRDVVVYSLTRTKLCEATWPLIISDVLPWLWHHYVLDISVPNFSVEYMAVLSAVLSPFWLQWNTLARFHQSLPWEMVYFSF